MALCTYLRLPLCPLPHMRPPPFAGLAAQYRQDLGDVAVLTPYKAQLAQLRRTFQQVG